MEKRDPKPFPKRTYFSAWLRKRNYQQLSDFISDRLPFRGLAIQTKQTLTKNILKESRFPQVDVGKNSWLYFRWSYGIEATGDSDLIAPERVEYVLDNLQHFLKWQTESDRKVRVMAVPNKHTIYPEYLPEQAKDDLKRTKLGREILHDRFKNSQDKRFIDLWESHRSAKQRSLEKLLYFPEDTHHSSWGSVVLMRTLIQSLAPDLWNSEHIKTQSEQTNWGVDLRRVLGYFTVNSELGLPIFRLERSGIETEQVLIGKKAFPSLAEAVESGLIGDRDNIINFSQKSYGAQLIAGKTMIIRDSFLAPSQQNSLAQYFQSVDYIHAQSNTLSQAFIHRSLKRYDTIVIAVVERNFLSYLEKLPRYSSGDSIQGERLIFQQKDGNFKSISKMGEKTNTQISNGTLEITSRKAKPFIIFEIPNLNPNSSYRLHISIDSPSPDKITLYYQSDYQPKQFEEEFTPKQKISIPVQSGNQSVSFFLQSAGLKSPWKLQFEEGEGTYEVKSIELFKLPD
ncbi:MAG: hypothetical protein ACFCBU_14655 [Cyanophyceae cyanobacterium]